MRLPSILITDDEFNIRLMLRTALETEGFDVLEASNGREALEIIRRDNPDVMILDLNMPVMDGMAVLEQLKSMPDPKPRVVVLTAYGSIPTAVKATRLGALDFLEKPITPDELRDTIRSILNEPELDSPAPIKPSEDYENVLMRIRSAMRMEDFANAESLLTKAADRKPETAAYFNLLGILYEVQHKWRLAKKCYGRSMRADHNYEPAQANMRRIFELFTFGHSKQTVVLGDETIEFAEPHNESKNHGAFP
jgi:two-component system response regulator (stage 0 sporulation protein F)